MKTINKDKMDSFFQEAIEQLQEEHKDGNRKLNIYRLQDDGILVIIMDCYDMILDQELYEFDNYDQTYTSVNLKRKQVDYRTQVFAEK